MSHSIGVPRSVLRAGVVGVGHLGKHHARIYGGIEGVRLSAISDTDPGRRADIALRTGARSFENYLEMIGHVDLVSVAVPTTYHRQVAVPFLEAGVNVLVEKPLAISVEDAKAICAAADSSGAILQVGHIERFNPAIREAKKVINDPRYVVADRISPYSFRSSDIGVVLDLMIHDLDIVLDLIDSPVSRIEAIGMPVMSPSEDIADARIHFENGALADLKSSRVSFKALRKFRVFQNASYLSIDYNERKIWAYRKKDMNFDASRIDPHTVDNAPALVMDKFLICDEYDMGGETDALTTELESFVGAVRGLHQPLVPGAHGLRAVEIAEEIQRQIHHYISQETDRAGLPMPEFLARSRFLTSPEITDAT